MALYCMKTHLKHHIVPKKEVHGLNTFGMHGAGAGATGAGAFYPDIRSQSQSRNSFPKPELPEKLPASYPCPWRISNGWNSLGNTSYRQEVYIIAVVRNWRAFLSFFSPTNSFNSCEHGSQLVLRNAALRCGDGLSNS